MDRRNKKAAQLAAAAATGGNGATGGAGPHRDRERDRERDPRNRKTVSPSSGQTSGRGGSTSRSNTLLSGSTAPTRVLSAGTRPPLPISISKAAPAPAETAPALRDADFTSRDTLPKSDDQSQEYAQNGANDVQQQEMHQRTNHEDDMCREKVDNNDSTNGIGAISSPPNAATASPFPVSTPPRPHRFAGRHGSSPSIDFGPVGSPPRASPMTAGSNPIRINGFSPGTSPRDHIHTTQPLAAAAAATAADPSFNAPGAQAANLFIGPSSPRGAGSGAGAGANSGLLAASLSLGAASAQSPPQMHTQPFSVGSLPILSRPIADSSSYAEALDEEDMEDFVPSSLKDLLTPEEQSRRMSRTSSSHAGATSGAGMNAPGGGMPTNATVQRSGIVKEDSRHRHSRSVPSASLLSQNLRSIWSDTPGELGQEGFGGLSPPTSALGTSPSFVPSPGLHAFDKDGPSPSMLSPSNASAAFLGLHQYMSQGPSRIPGGVSGVRAVSQGNIHHHHAGVANAGLNPLTSASSSFDARAHLQGQPLSSSPSRTTFASRVPAFDAFSSSPSQYTIPTHPGRPVPSAAPGLGAAPGLPEQPLSPASRALQAHIPGQSLPQGLAAGFSRIHLRPTSNAAFSPGSGSGSAAGSLMGNGGESMNAEWMSTTPTNQNQNHPQAVAGFVNNGVNGAPASSDQQPTSAAPPPAPNSGDQPDVGGLTSMFSHLSYSSVAAGGLRGHGHSPASAMPTAMSRRSSGRGGPGWGHGSGVGVGPGAPHPLSSPLSGPVLTNDDDDLFSMDEEK